MFVLLRKEAHWQASAMSATETITRITADNVATLFPDVDTSLAREVFPTSSTPATRSGNELDGYDEEQVRLMDEVCIVLDDDDKPIGSASKKTCISPLHPPAYPAAPLVSFPP